MAAESTGRGKFTQLMTYHILSGINLDKKFAIMDQESHANEVGDDGAITGPCFYGVPVAFGLELLDLLEKPQVNIRSLLQRSSPVITRPAPPSEIRSIVYLL